MAKLFELDICNDSWWGFINQSIDAFELLIKAIFNKHGLVYSKAENLPGVNAVFKVGNKVIKIFAPMESGCYSADYYEIETEALNHANKTLSKFGCENSNNKNRQHKSTYELT